jgi:hypothetical protein
LSTITTLALLPGWFALGYDLLHRSENGTKHDNKFGLIYSCRCAAAGCFPPATKPRFQEKMMKGQESKKAAKKEPAKTMKEKKEAKKLKKEEKQRQ